MSAFNVFDETGLNFSPTWAKPCNRRHESDQNPERIQPNSNQFKVDRLQKKYIYVSQLFISRMPKMRAAIFPRGSLGKRTSVTHSY